MSEPVPDELRGYFNADGLLTVWPSRKRRDKQILVLERLSGLFEPGVRYAEREVNVILKDRLLFDDHVLIRRELFDAGLLDRTPDGRAYWRKVVGAQP